MKKRIAETVNIRVNVGNFQHIELTKYAEKDIEYESVEDMQKQEDLMTDELIDNIIRNMKRIPDRLGKKTDSVEEVMEAISTGIPKWLNEGPEPNIANKAKDHNNKILAEEKANVDEMNKISPLEKADNELFDEVVENKTNKTNEKVKVNSGIDDDLFDNDDPSEIPKEDQIGNVDSGDKDNNDEDDLFN